jgi:hypothetical protein
MGRLRATVASLFAVLYAASIVHAMVTAQYTLVSTTTPVAVLAVTFLLGAPTVKAIRRKDDDRP